MDFVKLAALLNGRVNHLNKQDVCQILLPCGSIIFRNSWENKSAYKVYAEIPQFKDAAYKKYKCSFEQCGINRLNCIGISKNRNERAAANDISRRLLCNYQEHFKLAEGHIKKLEDDLRAFDIKVKMLAKRFQANIVDQFRTNAELSFKYGKIRVSKAAVYIDFNYIKFDTALTISERVKDILK